MNPEDEELYEKIKKDLLEIVFTKNWEYSVNEIIEWMSKKGYENVGKILTDALSQNIFIIGTIDDDGTVWLILGYDGDDLWDQYYKGKEGYSIDETVD